MSFKYKLLAVVLLLAVTAAGCAGNRKDRIYKKVHDRLTALESYTCEAEVYIKGNKEPGEFRVRQWFSVPDKYRIETLEPGIMKGKTTVFDGERLWIYYPYIEQIYLAENLDTDSEGNLFVGYFLRDMLEAESIRYYMEDVDGTLSLVLEVPVKGENRYLYRQRLYVDARDLTPIQLDVLDINGALTLGVRFFNFQYNPVLDPDLFSRDKSIVSMAYEGLDTSDMFIQSLEDAGNYVGFLPLEMDNLPDGFTADIIQVVENAGQKVLISRYKGDGKDFTILQKIYHGDGGDFKPEGEILNLDGRIAGYSEIAGMRKITWIEGNIKIDVIGNISRKLLVMVAEGIR